jgi:hypothetical protein
MLLVSSTLVARLALAPVEPAPPLVELQWNAPPECPQASAVHEAIAAMVPEQPMPLDPPPRAEAKIERESWGFRLQLRVGVQGTQRVRELRAQACASLVDAVAVEIAMLIEQAQEQVVEHEVVRPPAPPVVVPPPVAAAPVVQRRARLRWRVRAGVSIGGRVITGALAAPSLGVALVGRSWAGTIDLGHWPRGFAPLPGRTAEGSRLSLTTVTVGGCGRWPAARRFALAGCGGLELGASTARGVGLDGARRAADFSLAVLLSPVVEIGLAAGLRAALGPWVRLGVVRPGVRVDGVGEIDRAPWWSFGGVLRLELEIPGRKRGGRGI